MQKVTKHSCDIIKEVKFSCLGSVVTYVHVAQKM